VLQRRDTRSRDVIRVVRDPSLPARDPGSHSTGSRACACARPRSRARKVCNRRHSRQPLHACGGPRSIAQRVCLVQSRSAGDDACSPGVAAAAKAPVAARCPATEMYLHHSAAWRPRPHNVRSDADASLCVRLNYAALVASCITQDVAKPGGCRGPRLHPTVEEDEASVQNKARPGEYHSPRICLSYPARFEVSAAYHGQAVVPP
jgi:hypothetical protein